MLGRSLLTIVSFFAGLSYAVNLKVANHGGNASSPLMYGIMFEDINHSGDGGIYAELIQNRAFQGSTEFPSTIAPWEPVGNARLALQNTSVPLSWALPASVNVAQGLGALPGGVIGIQNPGWWGISVKPQKYTGSFWALGSYKGDFTVKLQSAVSSHIWASVQVKSECQRGKWVEHKFQLYPKVAAPDTNNTFVLEFHSGQGPLNFNLISLFPPTYNNRPNGNRPDLMEGLKGLKPSFFRFPGGNNIEGDTFNYRWKWNETIGPLTQRPGRPGTWGYENTDGLGLVEYLEWCEDLEVEPVLAIWSGVYLNGYNNTDPDVIPESEIGLYVQDALNELEFIMGGVHTKYGALRASLGHPSPWKINYVEIGNEDNLSDPASYTAYRFRAFYDAIHAAYPSITLLSSTGDLTATAGHSATDYHEYNRPNLYATEFNKWDNADRSHHILLGEYATIQANKADPTEPVDWSGAEPRLPYPIWIGAVGEAIYTLGAERNGDVVIGASYAPGFQNVNNFQWAPDLVSFNADPEQDAFSTSYYAIQLLSSHRFTHTAPMSSDSGFGPAFYVAGVNAGTTEYTFKAAVYNTTESIPFNINFEGLSRGSKATLTILNAPSGLSYNSIGGRNVVEKTVTRLTAKKGGIFSFKLKQYDIAVLTTF
ncbi:glycoside hydrolase superfamily [Xylogone sp. PMI_703]|nr:glycoside hydrolase superfamily [Xylogone sp. PMI_703]